MKISEIIKKVIKHDNDVVNLNEQLDNKANKNEVEKLQSQIDDFQIQQDISPNKDLEVIAIRTDVNGIVHDTASKRIEAIEKNLEIVSANVAEEIVVSSNSINIDCDFKSGTKYTIKIKYSKQSTPTKFEISTTDENNNYVEKNIKSYNNEDVSIEKVFEFVPIKPAKKLFIDMYNISWNGTMTVNITGLGSTTLSNLEGDINNIKNTTNNLLDTTLIVDKQISIESNKDVYIEIPITFAKGDEFIIEIKGLENSQKIYSVNATKNVGNYNDIYKLCDGYNGSYNIVALKNFNVIRLYSNIELNNFNFKIYSKNLNMFTRYSENMSLYYDKYKKYKFASLGDSITSEQVTGLGSSIPKYLGWENVGNFAIGCACACDKADTQIDLTIHPNSFSSQNVLSNQVRRLLQSTTNLGEEITWEIDNKTYSINSSYGVGQGNPSPDIIYIAIGTNDTNYTDDVEAQMDKKYEELDRLTIASALRWALQTLQTVYPYAQIIVNTPMQTTQTNENQFKWDKQRIKRNIIKKVCEEMGVEYIDSYAQSGINRFNSKFFGTEEGIHPREYIGKPILTKFLANKIHNLVFSKSQIWD